MPSASIPTPSSKASLVSVIIPAYNCADTIAAAVSSVFKQTYAQLEIIIINDGSTDNTLDIINQLQDSRLAVHSYSNAGAAASRNRGIEIAKGEFIAFLDSDDLWLPNKITEQLAALQDKPKAGVAYSWTDYIDEAGHFLRKGPACHYQGHVHERLLLGSFLISGSNPLIRKQALQRVGGFDESLKTCEDWDLWIQLSLHYDFVVVPEVHVQYRISPDSKSFRLDKHEAGGRTVIDKAFSNASKSAQVSKSKALSNFYKYLLFKLLGTTQNPKTTGLGNSQRAFKYLILSVYYHPPLLRQTKVILSALLKILVMSFPFRRQMGTLMPTD